mgnify:FL=1
MGLSELGILPGSEDARSCLIPEELRKIDRWVGALSSSKVPISPKTALSASVGNPATWGTYNEATALITSGFADYPGFVFAGDGIIGIDIDAGVDELDLITPLAADVISTCQSYTERSKSGRGFHILLRGTLPFRGRNNRAGVEIYADGRYFIMTGDVYMGFEKIEENQAAIDAIIERYFPEMLISSTETARTYRIYQPEWSKPTKGRVPLRPFYPKILQGGRNISLASLGGALHSAGWAREPIYRELVKANKVACSPLLPDSEIRTIARSVTRYKR